LFRDIGRHGSPRGVFMTRPPASQRYGRVVRWYTSGGRATSAPRTHFLYFDPAAESPNRRMAPRGSPRHRPARPPTGRIHVETTVTATLRAGGAMVDKWWLRHVRATNALYIFRPCRGELESRPSAKLLIRDIGRHGSPRGVFMTRPPSPQRYGRVVRWYTSGRRATCAPRTHFCIFRPRRRDWLESPNGAARLPETSAGTATHRAYS
jgi:hypothetical protein